MDAALEGGWGWLAARLCAALDLFLDQGFGWRRPTEAGSSRPARREFASIVFAII